MSAATWPHLVTEQSNGFQMGYSLCFLLLILLVGLRSFWILRQVSSNDLCICEEGSCSFAQFRILMFIVHDRTLNTRLAHVGSISLVENMILEAELEPSSGMSKHIVST